MGIERIDYNKVEETGKTIVTATFQKTGRPVEFIVARGIMQDFGRPILNYGLFFRMIDAPGSRPHFTGRDDFKTIREATRYVIDRAREFGLTGTSAV